ncbi:MAG: hypothetical protein ACK2UK_12270, partial [Candidatus Promineifilaceae bacterium]
VRFSIEGEPTAPASTVGATVSAENEPLAIVVAGAVLLLVAGGATYTVQRWRSTAEEETIRQEDEVDHLLNAVAALDDAYEAGNVDEATYDQRRTKLLNELAARWPQYGANHGNT